MWHFDYEINAVNACATVFPEDSITTCYFHFIKDCLRNAHDFGLKHVLKTEKPLRKWLRTLTGCVHLPPAHHTATMDYLLQHLPQTTESRALDRFVRYFRRQWCKEMAALLTNQWHNDGPRTTNFSEGWNNSLHNVFGVKHPGLGEFLQVKKAQFRNNLTSVDNFRR